MEENATEWANALTRRGRRWLAYVICAATLCLVGIGLLTKEVSDDISLLDTATSDNVQWTLSQVEVEHLEFEVDLSRAAVSNPVDLALLRREFDVFFSRVTILRDGELYRDLREVERFADRLERVEDFLLTTVETIDASDAVLLAELPEILAATTALRPTVRELSNAGLAHFAQSADERRWDISRTLSRLAILIAVLILALVALAAYLSVISARTVKRERENREANARIQTIVSTSLDAVISTDGTGAILDFNAAAEEIFDYSFAEVRGKNIADVIVPNHHKSAHNAGMERMQRNGEKRVVGHGRLQLEAVRRTGEIFPIELAIQSAETANGEMFIAFLRDISVRVTAQADLEDARDAALAGEKAKSEFLAVMSHEIRTPLNGLLGNLSLLQETEIAPAQKLYVENMETSGRLLMSHVTDVLDITRYDAGKLQRDLRPMHLGRFLQELIDNQAGRAAEQGTALSLRWIGPPVDLVLSDRDLLQPILLNLIGNAVKFTKDGTIEVQAEIVGGDVDRPHIIFRVIDTGIGIEESAQPLIFDDFRTGNVSYNRLAGGTGLGLGIAKRFATALGGEIGAASEFGVGSTFWVQLSFNLSDAEDDKPREMVLDTQPRQSVLVVEDNEINRQVVREMLASMGHRVTEARDGQSGVASAMETAFDLILMDINMPVMDGRTATRAIRSGVGPNQATPIVALTANVIVEDRENFLADGMTGVLTKPLTRQALTAIFADVSGDVAPSEPDLPELIEQAQLDDIKEALGETSFKKMRSRFLAEGAVEVVWLSERSSSDSTDFAFRAHRLAGSAAIFGATALHADLKQLEILARSEKPDGIADIQDTLSTLWKRTRKAVETQ